MREIYLFLATLLFAAVLIPATNGEEESKPEKNHRRSKLLPIFQVVNFPNNLCGSTDNRNGTCYTSEECSSKGGSSLGSCASGYGVCCVFSLSCGGSSSENITYIQQAATTSLSTSPCNYKICKCSSNICRIRLDFTTLNIVGPAAGTVITAGAVRTTGGSIGDCVTDQFSVNSPGNTGSPVICGLNTGQHMIVDASDECNTLSMAVSSASSATRQWDIKVTQYECGSVMAGPDGCLQYFIGATGTIASYNFPTMGTAVGSTATHLSNQCYTICIRRESGNCGICYYPTAAVTAPTAAIQNSFGLSPATATGTVDSVVGSLCSTDYLEIPGAQDVTSTATLTYGTFGNNPVSRLCGRIFSSANGVLAPAAYDPSTAGMQISVCSQIAPFRMVFKTDEDEVTTTDDNLSENWAAPGGIVGFSLEYVQQAC